MANGGVFGPPSGQSPRGPLEAEASAIADELRDLVDRMELDFRARGTISAEDAERIHELRLRLAHILGQKGD